MIYIGQDYYIGGDPLNITLYQKKTVKKKGETEGKEYFDELGYYHTTAELLAALTRRKIRIDISSLESLDSAELYKYFGRDPCGYGYARETSGGRCFIEWKLFNSTTSADTLKRYINIAVALTDLLHSSQHITRENVRIALEYGYNRDKFGKWNSLYAPTATSA